MGRGVIVVRKCDSPQEALEALEMYVRQMRGVMVMGEM